jgi:hypothetical protein
MISTLDRRAGCAVGGREGTATLATSRRPREEEDDEQRGATRRAPAEAAADDAAPAAGAPRMVFIADAARG